MSETPVFHGFAHRSAMRDPMGSRTGPSNDRDTFPAGMFLIDPRTVPITARLDDRPERPIRFRREFDVRAGLLTAELRVSALGIYEAECNGDVVGDEVLAPGWTSYRHRIRIQTHDVIDRLTEGVNCIGVTVAEGWFRGRVGFEGGKREVYGSDIGPIVELHLTYDDSTEIVPSDTTWRASYGPHLFASLYDGEHVDARLTQRGWSRAGYDDTGWSEVVALGSVADRLVEPVGPPVRRIEELDVAEIITTPSGATVLDIGQNISGWMRFTVSGPAGTEITLRHAEVLEHDELGTRPLRDALQTDRFILSGDGAETFEPKFTIHGFRYVEVAGWPGELDASALQAVVVHSDMERTGWFDCSHDGLNRLHENVIWSMRGNFVDIPTDCPQRDERLGWTGDIQVFAPAAAFLYDCRAFLRSWLDDLAAEQEALGTVPLYVPWVQLVFPPLPTAAWGDAAVIVPWVLYERFGDESILRRQYPSMRAWVDQVADRAGERHVWDTDLQLGDWLDPSAPPDRPWEARTDANLVATAYHAHSARLLAGIAAIIGEHDDAERYGQLAGDVVEAFNREFVTPTGRMASDAPTAYALALCFDLLPRQEQRDRASARLAELVQRDGHHIGTGFVGTPLICDALVSAGHLDDAYHLLLQDECPSWLYPVTMGATTIWERWDSMLPDGSINPGDMTSFNHYALGAVADFLHRVVAGLGPGEPGYRTLLVRPRPGGGLTHASARLRTVHGEAAVGWRRRGSTLEVEVTVPAGCRAEVDIEGCDTTGLRPGTHQLTGTCRPVEDDPHPPRPGSPADFVHD